MHAESGVESIDTEYSDADILKTGIEYRLIDCIEYRLIVLAGIVD